MSDGMTEAYRHTVIRRKINKNVSIDIDLKRKAIRIMNNLDGHGEVEVKLKTLQKIVEQLTKVLENN
jgi:ribosomal protein L9